MGARDQTSRILRGNRSDRVGMSRLYQLVTIAAEGGSPPLVLPPRPTHKRLPYRYRRAVLHSGNPSPMTQAQVERWDFATKPARAALRHLLKRCNLVLEPADNSEAARELEEEATLARPKPAWGMRPVLGAFGDAGASLGAAWDFASGYLVVTEATAQIALSPSVLARAAVQASARCGWLFESGIGARERVARRMNERLYDLREQFRLQGYAPAADHVARAQARAAEIEQAAKALGYEVKSTKNRPRYLSGGRPSDAALFSRVLGSPELGLSTSYLSGLSSVVHAAGSGIRQFIVGVDFSQPQLRAQIGISPRQVWQDTMSIGLSVAMAQEAHLALYGVRDKKWDGATRHFGSVLTQWSADT